MIKHGYGGKSKYTMNQFHVRFKVGEYERIYIMHYVYLSQPVSDI